MLEKMSNKEFNLVWSNISETKKIVIINYLNKMVSDSLEDKNVDLTNKLDWVMNIAFDTEEPIEYIYLKGNFTVTNNNRIGNVITISVDYINVSLDIDDFLDRKKIIDTCDSSIKKFNINVSHSETKPIDYNSDKIKTLDLHTEMINEMNVFINMFRDVHKNVSYNDAKDIFFLTKIKDLQSQIMINK